MGQIWSVGFDDGYNFTASATLDGGNIRLFDAIDRTPELGTMGGHFSIGSTRHGRKRKSDNIPTEFRWGGGARRIPDVLVAFNGPIVSERVRSIFEGLQPDVHQFCPLQTSARGKANSRHMYILNLCNRIDSVGRAETTVAFVSHRAWEVKSPLEVVFSRARIGGRKLWHDRHVHHSAGLTDDVKAAFEDQQITGLRCFGFRAVWPR